MKSGVWVLDHDTCFKNMKKDLVQRYGKDIARWIWKNQDYCLINRPVDFEVFKNTDMHIWHGIKNDVERKLARDILKWQDAGYVFTYKVFTNVGHGGLIAEHAEQFIEEVKVVHAASLEGKNK